MKNLSVRVVTYNVADSGPPNDSLIDLVGVGDIDSRSDVIFVGLQEVENGDKWVERLKEIVTPYNYVLLKVRYCWKMWLAVFIQRNLLVAVTNIESETTASGVGGILANKGGVSIRFELCGVNIIGVCAHMSAHTENLTDRIEDYVDIISNQSFRDPDVNSILDHDYVIWFGDLNFRIDGIAKEEVERLISEGKYSKLWDYDQLLLSRKAHRIFEQFEEGNLNFAPTFKFDIGTNNYDSSKKQRVPSWTDRVLFMAHTDFALDHNVRLDSLGRRVSAVPRHLPVRGPPSEIDIQMRPADQSPKIELIEYRSIPSYTYSDHKPVYARLSLAIPEFWFSLPVHFLSPTGGSTQFIS
ncbi:Inositol polyphosphate 5-phosphatase K [Cichlidogyrus casuarinus]|uniref:Inositol polyphosphate 5-phosphatase K n=1 Tax=Cichlidogyrus casuarinus TaxID=1844966 RepID=A0ABD2QKG0_9PLAT